MTKTEKTIIQSNIQQQLKGAFVAPVVLQGGPGTAKTSTVKALAAAMGLKIINQSIASLTTEQMSGLPDFIDVGVNFDKYSSIGATGAQGTRWTVPELIESANMLATSAGTEGVILLLDDLHMLNQSTMPYMLDFLLERRLGQYLLDPKVAIVATMNTSDEADFSGFASPVINRLALLELTFDFDEWYSTYGKKLHFYVASFLKTHSSYIIEDESVSGPFATPRAYDFLANTFDGLGLEFVKNNAKKIASQYISNAASAELAKHIAYVEAIDFSAKVAARSPIAIDALKPLEQILYAYIINYVDTITDAAYVMSLIDDNIESSNFIGFVVGEIYTKFLTMADGKPLSNGLRAMVYCTMGKDPTAENFDKLSAKDAKLLATLKYVNHSELLKIATEFIH